LRFVIEIDGGYQLSDFQKEYDDFRDEDMMAMGITVIRFTNNEVIKESKFDLQKLSDKIRLLQNINTSTNLV
jgi:very-short-patch-repair endonuclease